MMELFTRFDAVFFEKTRLSLLTLIIQEEEAAFNRLKLRLKMSDGALYTHLEKLINAGYVEKKKQIAGTNVQTVYSATESGKQQFSEYLLFMEEMIKNGQNTRKEEQ